MAAGNFAQALSKVLVYEGGKDDNPRDPGGRTNEGITHIDYDLYRKSKGLPTRDVWNMDNQERDEIYRTRYWDVIDGDVLPSGIDFAVFDGAVNSGPAQSVKWLQRALGGVTVDGEMGPLTLAAVVNNPDLQRVAKAALQARRVFLQSLRIFSVFGKGWMKRVNDVEAVALAWIAGQQLPSITAAPRARAKAPRSNAISPPMTAPGDVIATAAGAGLVATLAASSNAVAIAPSSPAATTPSPAAQTAPASAPSTATTPAPATPQPPATAPATAPATPATPPAAPTAPKPSAVAPSPAPAMTPAKPSHPTAVVSHPQAQQPLLTISQDHLPLIAVGMGVLLVSGLILSWSSRHARAKLADALGDTPRAKTLLKLVEDTAKASATGAPIVSTWTSFAKKAAARVLSAVWIMGTIAVNVIALAKLLQVLGIEHESWHGPFVVLGNFYDVYAAQAFAAVSAFVHLHTGFTLPQWLMPGLILYVSMASAFVVGGTQIVGRDTSSESFLGAVVHAGWILAIPAFVLDAIRYRVVTRFARQNTLVFFAYILAFTLIYIGARYVNERYMTSPEVAAKTTTIMKQVGHDAEKLAPVLTKP